VRAAVGEDVDRAALRARLDEVCRVLAAPDTLQELALELARPGGTITLAGLSPMGSSTNLPGAVT